MMEERHIAFGMRCTAIGMKARFKEVSLRDRVNLATDALTILRDDDEACAAVVDFLGSIDADPVGAGNRLLAFVDYWRVDVDPFAPVETLSAIENEPEYDWQRRADIGN